ncbi:MAG: PAS domain S-box protein [Chloroflexi bacterium]|nr:PAS domain S-box protein [Chloroflexota bacterium]
MDETAGLKSQAERRAPTADIVAGGEGPDVAVGVAASPVAGERGEASWTRQPCSERLADAAPVGLFEADARGRYTYVNRRWSDMSGLAPDQALGNGWIAAIHPDDRERVVTAWSRLVRSDERFRAEYRIVLPTGEAGWVEGRATLAAGDGDGTARYVGVLADIADLKEKEQRLAFLAEAGAALAFSLDLEATLGRVAHLATTWLADWCAVDLVNPSGGIRRVAAAHADPYHEAEVQELARRYPPHPARPHPVWRALRTGTSTIETGDALVSMIAHDEEHVRRLRSLGVGAMLVVPLATRGRILGAMTLIRASAERRFARGEILLAEELARHCAVAVENARLYAAEQAARAAAERAADRMAHLQAATAALSGALTHDQVAEVILDQGVAALGAQAGAIALLTEDGLDLDLVHSSGLTPAVREQWQRFAITEPLPLAEAVRTGQDIWVDADDAPVRFPSLASAQAAGGFAALPLLAGARPIGGLAFRFPRDRVLDDDDRSFARTLAEECSEAIERARLYEAEQRAHARAEQLAAERAAMLSQVADGVVVADQGGRIAFANVAACTLLGRADEALVGVDLGRLTGVKDRAGQSDRPELMPLARAALLGERIDNVELRVLRPDGTTALAEGSATPVLAEDGSRIGAVLTIRDVTARRELDRLKEELFANVSHDLRTPIATIKASIEVVLENEPPELAEPFHRLLENIHRESERMTTLVDDLLDLTRLQAGRLRLRAAQTDLRALVGRLARTIEPLAGRRGQRLVVELPRRAVVATVDAERLERALLNLLINAHRYGRDGGMIRLALKRRRREILVTVADDGPGIAEEDQPRIFERFYRPKTEAARRSQGSGLGLPIARAMVELHGGRIWLESRPGEGAAFHIALPTGGAPEATP